MDQFTSVLVVPSISGYPLPDLQVHHPLPVDTFLSKQRDRGAAYSEPLTGTVTVVDCQTQEGRSRQVAKLNW